MKDHPLPIYPAKDRNIAGMEVPAGGSHCLNCKFLKDKEKKICGEPNFIKWNFGSNVIPAKSLDAYCSMWYEPKTNVVKSAMEGKNGY